jgi:hypothetical protein
MSLVGQFNTLPYKAKWLFVRWPDVLLLAPYVLHTLARLLHTLTHASAYAYMHFVPHCACGFSFCVYHARVRFFFPGCVCVLFVSVHRTCTCCLRSSMPRHTLRMPLCVRVCVVVVHGHRTCISISIYR